MIDIKDISGNIILSIPINEDCKRKFTLMKEDYILLKFNLENPVFFKLGSYAECDFGTFEVCDLQKPTFNTLTAGYDYELRLDSHYWKWKNKVFKFTPETGGQEASWNLTATLDVQAGIILRNLKALGYKYKGQDFVFSIDSTVENKSQLMSYENINILDALFSMAKKWDCECWVTENVIHFGRCEFGDSVSFEIGVNVDEMTRSESQSTYATRIYAFGSTRNIPSNYRPASEQIVVNCIVQKRLMLPEGTPYIDAYPSMTMEEAVEQIVVFDEVYPRRIGTMSDVSTKEYTDTIENEDGTTTEQKWYAYRFKDTGITFSKDYILPGEELKIQFQSGKLNGMTFSVIFDPDNKDEQLWEIVRNEDYGRPLPDEVLCPENGDTYVLSGWDSTKIAELGLVDSAEEELKGKAEEYVKKSKIDPDTYTCKMMSDSAFSEDGLHNLYGIGQKVNLINKAYFDNGRLSRVIGFEFNLDYPYDSPTYTVGETAAYSRIGEIEEKLESITLAGQTYAGETGSGVYLIRRNDSTPATDSNAFSALRSLSMFLRKDKADRTPHKVSSDTAFEVGDFVPGSSGAIVYKDKETGHTVGELDKLHVRMKAYFESLEILNVNSLGGKQIISPAGSVRLTMAFGAGDKYEIVTEGEDGNDVVTEVTVPQGTYRCFFLAEQDGQEVENRFKVGNQLQSKDFNIKKPGKYNQVANHYYWRLVTGVSTEPVRIGELGYHYVDLSVTDCDTGSDVPAKGDVVAQLGDRNDVDYQNALVFSSVDTFSPSITLYQGINSYSLVGKDVVSYGVDKTTGKAFMNVYGEMYIGDRGGSTFVRYTQDNGVEINGKLAVGTKLGDGKTIEQALEDATQSAIDAANENISNFTDAVTKDIEGLQNQIDGVIESFNGFGAPTLTNFPANEWTTDEARKAHDKDTYTDKTEYVDDVTTPTAGQSWKWQYTSPTDYGWVKIADSDATRALLDAARAQDTADGKRRVFVAQPTVQQAYDVGDLWVNATYGTTYSNDVLRAVTAKAAGSPFSINHWTKASKYTDDTRAEQVQQNVNNLSTTVSTLSGTVSGMKDFTDTAFADGIVDRSEASAIDKYLNNINTTKADAQNAYGKVYENALLDGVAKTNLANAYSAFSASATELVTSITNAIADGKTTSTERADVDAKYTNFNTKYGDFVAYLNAANKYIQDKINTTANDALTQIGGLAYLKQAFKEDTTIEGGLIQSSVLALGYTSEGGVYKVMSGTNGIYDAASLGGGIASWWGGAMKDRGNYTEGNMPSDVAKALIRMDGSGYLANGGIWWGTDGKIHADPQSFIINENQLGDYLELFQIIYKGGTKEIDYIIPQYVMQKVEVATSVKIGNAYLKYDASSNSIYVEGENGAEAGFWTTGFLSSKGISQGGESGGGATSLSELSDVLLTSLASDDLLKWNGSKWVNVPMSDIQGVSDWADITGKPTTLAGYGITDAKISGGVITLGANSITPITAHQSLADYVTLNTAQTITGLKTFGLKVGAVDGSEVNRISITPYGHTGGPWYINSYDIPHIAYLRIKYGSNTIATFSNTGELLVANKIVKNGGTSSQFLKADGSVDSNAYITASDLDHIISVDSRSSVTNPNTFGNGLRAEFKFNSANGLNDGGTYNGVLHFKAYGSSTDHSGGYPHQLGFTGNNNIWHRIGSSATSWSSWRKLLDTVNYSDTLDSRYVKRAGDTMTGVLNLQANNYADSYIGALNLNNSNIYGVNAIYTADLSDDSREGIHFYRDASHVDTIWSKNGVLRFVPNRAFNSTTDGSVIWHAGNDGSGSGLDADLLDGKHDGFLSANSLNNITSISDANQGMQNGDGYNTGGITCWRGSSSATNVPSRSSNAWNIVNIGMGGKHGTSYQYAGQLYFGTQGNHFYYRAQFGSTFKDWRTVAFTDSNVSSATKLQTARTLWGQSFDGTGNVSGDMSGVGSITASGNVGIGGTSNAYKLYVNGHTYTNGWYYSDTLGFFIKAANVYYTQKDNYCPDIYSTGANEICFGSHSDELYVNYRASKNTKTPTKWAWKNGTSSGWAAFKLGSIRLYNDLIIPYNPGTWISMAKTTDCIYADVSNSVSSAHCLFRTKWNNGYALCYGGLGDQLGFYAFTKSNIDNNTNAVSWSTYWTSNGTIHHGGALEAYGTIFSNTGIWTNGYVSAKGQNTSDVRLKTDIKSFNATSIIKSLRPVSFKWNTIARKNSKVFDTDEVQYGLIAQEVKAVAPWAAVDNMFKDGYMGVRYDKFIPVIMKAQIETIDEVTDLKRRLNAVERENERLKKEIQTLKAA